MIASPQDGPSPCPGCATTPDPLPPRYIPFAWQVGNRLVLLDRNEAGWVVAELVFNDRFGHYDERRRVAYESSREAAGVILATVITDDLPTRQLVADALDDWLGEVRAIV